MVRLYRLLVGLFAATVLVRLVAFLGLVVLEVQDRGDITFPEGARVYAVRRVAAGLPLYQDFRQLPHAMVPYGPLYFYVSGWLDRALGGGPFDSYFVSRCVSFACIALLAGLCAAWASEIAGGRLRGAVIGAYAVACPVALGPSLGVQVDSLAILVVAASLWVASRPWGTWRWSCVWLLAVVAWSTKQNSVALAPALAAWLIHTRGWRPAALWCAAWIAGIAIAWGVFDWSTDGLFRLNAVISLKRPLILQFGLNVLVTSLPFVGVGMLAAAASWPAARRSDSLALPAWWLLFAGAQGALSCFGEGGGANYLTESWIAACLLLARLLVIGPAAATTAAESAVTDPAPKATFFRATSLVLLSIGCLHDAALFFYPNFARHLVYFLNTTPAIRQAGRTPNLERFVRSYPGELLIQYPYLAVIASRPPAVLDVLHYRLMVECGVVSVEPLVERLERGEYEFVILRDQIEDEYDGTRFMRWPKPVWSALRKKYFLAATVDGQFIYSPRDESK